MSQGQSDTQNMGVYTQLINKHYLPCHFVLLYANTNYIAKERQTLTNLSICPSIGRDLLCSTAFNNIVSYCTTLLEYGGSLRCPSGDRGGEGLPGELPRRNWYWKVVSHIEYGCSYRSRSKVIASTSCPTCCTVNE